MSNTIDVVAKWSGSWPCLCYGEWTLIVNGKDVSNKIPEDYRTEPMDTYGTYSTWSFKDWIEEFEEYEDGLDCGEWIAANEKWLDKISKDEAVQIEIFKAFQAEDWRRNSCGGCI